MECAYNDCIKQAWLAEGLASNINQNFFESHILLNSVKVVDPPYKINTTAQLRKCELLHPKKEEKEILFASNALAKSDISSSMS